MSPGLNNIQTFRSGKLFLILSVSVMMYWLFGKIFNIYRFAVVGAVYELLWIFMTVILFMLPVITFIYWRKHQFSIRSLHLYSLLTSIATILLLLFV